MNFLSYITKPVIPVIRLSGPIMYKSSDIIQQQLSKIRSKNLKALAVVVNSPGGLPVQSDIICQKLKLFASTHHVPIYTFAEDVAASGGYFVLCIGDKVFVDPASLVGSIGVVRGWFGFKQALVTQGMQNHQFTSNKNSSEALLSPFEDFNNEGADKFKDLMKSTHSQFIAHVERHRKLKIKVPDAERETKLYNADVFDGETAVSLGLADAVGNYQVILNRLHPGCNIKEMVHKGWIEQARQIGEKGFQASVQEQII